MAELRNKNLEFMSYAEEVKGLRKRALSALEFNVKKKNFYKKHTLEPIEIPVEIPYEIIEEVEVEVIREVEVPVEVIVEKEVIREIEVPVEVEKIVEVEKVVEIIKEIDVPRRVVRYVEVIKEVPVEVEKIVKVPYEVIKEVEKIVEVEVIKEVIVEVPIEVIVEKEVLVPVDKLVVMMGKLKDEYDTNLKLSKLSKKAMEKRYQTALAQAKIAHTKETIVMPTKKYSNWSATYIYILTMFSLTQILWMLI